MSEPLRDKIENVLIRYNCQYTRDGDGDGQRLIEVLSPFDTIEEGKDEILHIADEIACAIVDDIDSHILSQAELINRLLADRERLTGDLQANSMMLSRQCDLAREAERQALTLTRRLRKYEGEARDHCRKRG